MNSVFTKIRDKHALWYKGIVFIFCVCLCTYLLPKHNYQQTDSIHEGDVWLNDDIITSFDFLIKKTDTELNAEQQKKQDTKLYFTKTEINTSDLITEFAHDASEKSQEKLKHILDSIYTIGLYYQLTGTPAHSDSIYIVNGNEVVLTPFSKLIQEDVLETILKHNVADTILLQKLIVSLPSNIEYREDFNKEISVAKNNESNIYKSKINKGDVLIHKNDVITAEQSNIIKNYNTELQEQEQQSSNLTIWTGKFLACLLILGIMMLFLAFFRKSIFSQNSHVTFIYLIIVILVLASHTVCLYNPLYIYAVPFCLVPILVRIFFDSRTSLFSFLIIILLCAFFTNDKFEFVFVQLIAGIGTIFSVADMGKRSKLLVSAFLTLIFYTISFTTYHLINDTTIAIQNITNYIPFVISAVCVLFAFPLIFLFEKLFGFISDFTLLELCDLNSPLLRQLSQKVPGTFQHSLQVANLAEEACYKIGGNALLVRTGAMYHDIGKIVNPRFFTENQVGEVSPHEDLSSQESAKIIIDHVIHGIEIAKANKLPETIIDFIRTHHGTTTTRFFLHNYKKEHEGEIINEDLFRYPGPIPFSRETAILMMADGVEAASRSIKKYDAIAIDDLVDRIINHQINENQFINADITFRDINQIKKIFKKRLMNIYHVRIEYPR
jgi:putative nucleotidyltransferase with HDIG domain